VPRASIWFDFTSKKVHSRGQRCFSFRNITEMCPPPLDRHLLWGKWERRLTDGGDVSFPRSSAYSAATEASPPAMSSPSARITSFATLGRLFFPSKVNGAFSRAVQSSFPIAKAFFLFSVPLSTADFVGHIFRFSSADSPFLLCPLPSSWR